MLLLWLPLPAKSMQQLLFCFEVQVHDSVLNRLKQLNMVHDSSEPAMVCISTAELGPWGFGHLANQETADIVSKSRYMSTWSVSRHSMKH